MNKKLIERGRELFSQYPKLRPVLRIARGVLRSNTIFSGWGMSTSHQFPWIDEYNGDVFRKTSKDIKKSFDFGKVASGYDSSNVDELLWRHWNISSAVKYAIKFAEKKEYNFVECGVAHGMSAFFALREIFNTQKVGKNFSMHLYDSWGVMKTEYMTKKEKEVKHAEHRFEKLDINKTKKNLSEFVDYLTYHIGYIPQTFNIKPDSPENIVYLHIDLNSANVTQSALEFFFPRLQGGGVIMFDDYGSFDYEETKKIIDAFFKDKSGILIKFPTRQAMYCHR